MKNEVLRGDQFIQRMDEISPIFFVGITPSGPAKFIMFQVIHQSGSVVLFKKCEWCGSTKGVDYVSVSRYHDFDYYCCASCGGPV